MAQIYASFTGEVEAIKDDFKKSRKGITQKATEGCRSSSVSALSFISADERKRFGQKKGKDEQHTHANQVPETGLIH